MNKYREAEQEEVFNRTVNTLLGEGYDFDEAMELAPEFIDLLPDNINTFENYLKDKHPEMTAEDISFAYEVCFGEEK